MRAFVHFLSVFTRLVCSCNHHKYYMANNMFLFDEFQSNRARGSRRPVVSTLYDVFANIAADESEHVSTMQSCQDPEAIVQSPNNEKTVASVAASLAAVGALSATRDSSGLEIGGDGIAALFIEDGLAFFGDVMDQAMALDETLSAADLSSIVDGLTNTLPWLDESIVATVVPALVGLVKELVNFI